ncbi:hypothetical protein B0T26DRAFT_748022 [Lasiosphaeria miniovina]|uniref:Uncharacterized protein n=1 Tax=Lasiosphaeria miniovina TaxID=1954250 RepID=A0AA40E5C1_9PEZI|nr:uncharacterized protein B0T26DRAFT_748022 [Lasiosphaeria miniovina]KAK0727715.1 hypothetical protein B0T26DRAFT_748022 [Lasiosphaeria miniovina]
MATATRATLATVATIATANRATHYRHYHPGYARMTLLFTDSVNALTTVMNPLNGARTRCIDIRYK